MGKLGKVICGRAIDVAPIDSPLSYLTGSLDRFSDRTLALLGSSVDDDVVSLGPFCARVLLENACAALVGRLDPFRLMYLGEYQAQSDYDPNKRYKTAFSWQGDVIPEDKAVAAQWGPDHDMPKVSRALLSKYVDHLCWRPAVNALLDYLANVPPDEDGIVQELLQIDPENFIDAMKGRSMQLYSLLSKGVHWEFFSSVVQFDVQTVKSSIRDMYAIVNLLGLVSHFVPTAYASLEGGTALDEYIKMKKLVQ